MAETAAAIAKRLAVLVGRHTFENVAKRGSKLMRKLLQLKHEDDALIPSEGQPGAIESSLKAILDEGCLSSRGFGGFTLVLLLLAPEFSNILTNWQTFCFAAAFAGV
jgi:hypothetical protein